MKQEVFITNIDSKIPMTVSIVKFDNIFHHMHTNPELILMLEGQCDLFIGEQKYHMKDNDMVIVNKNTFHNLETVNEATLISVLLDLKSFGLTNDEIEQTEFNLNSMINEDDERYDQLRYLIYSIIKYNTMENVNSIYTNRAISFSFFAQLMNGFSIIKQSNYKINDAYNTLTTIGSWLNDHYSECVSLSYICEKFNYTPSYLSRLFKSITGYTFIEIYDYIRVNYSLNSLLLTNKTIEEISLEHGFENARSYVRAFKKLKNQSPTQYRQNYANTKKSFLDIDPKILKKNALDHILAEYNEQGYAKNYRKSKSRNTEVILDINTKAPKSILSFRGSDIIELNGAGDLFTEDSYKALKETKIDFNYKYVLIPNIFARKTYILTQDNNGKLIVNFLYLYKMIEKTLALDALPYLIFEYDDLVLTIDQFYDVMLEVLNYIYEHFYQQAKDMMICFSISNNTNKKHNFTLNNQFFDIYIKLMNVYKQKLPHLKYGLPLFTLDEIYNNTYFEFLKRVKQYNVSYDFIPIKYSNISNKDIIKDKDDIENLIAYLKKNNGYVKNKICLQGISFSEYSLLNDTLYGSSYIIKNYIDSCEDLIGYSKDKLQDSYLINLNEPNPFHGENGMLTYSGIKKASYSAYTLMSKLGKELIQKGKNYIIANNNKTITILLNNYNHYSSMFAEGEYFELSNLNRYNCFPISSNILFHLNLINVKKGTFEITRYKISEESGSSYDKWLAMGAKNLLEPKEIQTLKNLSNIEFNYSTMESVDNKLQIDATVAPLETILIEIKYIYK